MRGCNNMLRGGEIRLAHREPDDRDTGGTQLTRLLRHGGGGGFLDAVQAIGKLQHDLLHSDSLLADRVTLGGPGRD